MLKISFGLFPLARYFCKRLQKMYGLGEPARYLNMLYPHFQKESCSFDVHGACITRSRKQSMGRSRDGLTSKIHAVVDTNGLPVRLALTAGEAHDNRLAGKLLSRLKSGTMLLADRGYDADWIRALVRQHGAWANIPPKRNRTETLCFSPYLYRARNLVERFFNKIKHCRRVATRYDKLGANYLAFVQLASIRLWLRANESTSLVRGDIRIKRKLRQLRDIRRNPPCLIAREQFRRRSPPRLVLVIDISELLAVVAI
jgi:transposase